MESKIQTDQFANEIDGDISQYFIPLQSIHPDKPRLGKCGYCDKEDQYIKFGFRANKMENDIYEDLINRGWTRSGNYFYQPNLQESCCKSYCAKIDTKEFKMSKQQKKIWKKFDKLTKMSEQEFLQEYEMLQQQYQQKKQQDQSFQDSQIIFKTPKQNHSKFVQSEDSTQESASSGSNHSQMQFSDQKTDNQYLPQLQNQQKDISQNSQPIKQKKIDYCSIQQDQIGFKQH
ncbi:hypothetical protein PPERSA_04384 [Pseudocohnilembus persalinus]|uniref:N-end aminoacyl transferase N-terminal domain-containing protein n=1 Tax=Pseudocohnilembus persalinus TaxID=266149 RepID=A0A0V0QQL1_PSEPJ|nr:hypothetical protein PPERSA_04384 [Pseudocohnilembus persalinus]|eukprot:KRX04569.1 hypothetical protein PPERSA_04384 [Pseudocohnilembus persalinus]